jgi:soluble epoxide hydrolase / lipid-phosphate phosphatase
MAQLEKKKIQTKRALTYTYYASAAGEGDPSKPALFFIHGFPDSALMWSEVVDALSDLPYRVVVPDLLGYAGTSKPSDVSAYKFSGQAADLLEILEAENIDSVIIIGHDWGAMLTCRFYNNYPERCSGMILCNVAYQSPSSEKFDLDAHNAMTKQRFGYPIFQYWYLFTAPDGYKIMNKNVDRFWEVLHGADDDWMMKMFAGKDAMTDYFSSDKRVELKSFAKEPKWKDDFSQRLGKDGFEGPTNWYKAYVLNVQSEDDKSIPKENYVVKVPFFFLGCTGDTVCRTDLIHLPKEAGLLPDFEMTEIESGHWCAMEQPAKVAEAFRGFLSKRFP